MSETKLKPFIKGFISVLVILTLYVLVCVAIIAPRSGKALNNVVQSTPIVSEPCEFLGLPEETAIVERIVLIPEVAPEVPAEDPNPYVDLVVTDTEKKMLACMAYNEARGEPFEGQIAVVQVALNRYMHEAFDGSISDILLAPNQFSVGSVYGEGQMEAVEAALAGEPVLDLNTDVVFFSTGKLTYGSYYKTIGGHVFRTYF